MTAINPLAALLWLVNLALAVALAWPFFVAAPLGERLPQQAQRAVSPLLSLAQLALPPLDALGETLARPLFTATRRPGPPTGTLQPGTAQGPRGERLVLGRYILNGVVLAGERKLVLMRNAQTGKSLRVAEGETLDDWTLATVAADHIVLKQGAREERVPVHSRPPGQ